MPINARPEIPVSRPIPELEQLENKYLYTCRRGLSATPLKDGFKTSHSLSTAPLFEVNGVVDLSAKDESDWLLRAFDSPVSVFSCNVLKNIILNFHIFFKNKFLTFN